MVPVLLLLLLTAIRLAVAAASPLAPDEAYYWVWSRALQPGYLDHPPIVALWIRLGTLIAGDTTLGVRLLGPIAAAGGSVLLAAAADRLFPGRRLGVAAAGLLNATVMFGVGAVTMTPDTPLLFFMTAGLYALARVPEDPRWWLLVGLAGGLGLDSKYTAGLLGVGAVLWAAWAWPRSFRSAWLWAGGAAAALLFAPVVAWNAGHGWASFVRQGGRTGNWHPADALRNLGELLGSQFALATPAVFALFALGLWLMLRGARRDRAWALLASLAFPGLLLFLQHALGDRVQANWLAVAYPPLAIAAASMATRWWAPAAALGFVMTGAVYLQASAAPFVLPRRMDPTLIRLAGWDALARDADALRVRQGARYLASEEYGPASLLAWWAPPDAEVVGAETRWSLFALPSAPPGPGLLLLSQRRSEPPDPALWQEATQVGWLLRGRHGVEAEAFRVYRVVRRQGAAAALLPRPGGK